MKWIVALYILAGIVAAGALILLGWRGYGAETQRLDGGPRLAAPQLKLADRPVIGDPAAPVTAVIVVDFASAESAEQHARVTRMLRPFLAAGRVKLYHKYFLTAEEYAQKRGRFKYASAAICHLMNSTTSNGVNETLLNESLAFVQGLFATSAPAGCDEELVDELLEEDMLESRLMRIVAPSIHVSIDGRDDTILVGTPSSARLNRTIRNKEVVLGR